MHKEELDRICRDRELETVEVFGENAYYGLARILKWYAGWPEEKAVKAVIPHGVVMDPGFVSDSEKKIPLPTVFCYPDFRLEAYRNQTRKWVVPEASPYLYLLELLSGEEGPPERKGTLFFPAHSTHHITTEMNFARLADKLLTFDEELQPVEVCLYWKDYNQGRAAPFRERGLEVHSAGHMFDPDFLFRFHRLCSRFRYAASNEIGSNVFYAVKSGCSFFFLNEEVERKAEAHHLPENVLDFDHSRAEIIYGLFSEPMRETTDKQMELVDRFLGAGNMRGPEELHRLLQRCERRDRWGHRAGGWVPSFPRLARGMGRLYPGYLWRRLREGLQG